MNGPIGIRRDSLRATPGAHSTRDPVVSGTWYTPSQARPVAVTIIFTAGGIGSGDSANFDIDVRDTSDAVLSGYPVHIELTRGGLVNGTEDISDTLMFMCPAGFDYRVTDSSAGVATSSVRAIEDTL